MKRGTAPNLVLVVWDTCRADAVEVASANGPTPALAQLASRGCSHAVAVAPSNWTLPSHASMFTGLLPGALGLTSLPEQTGQPGMGYAPVLEAKRDRLLPAVLSARGYATAGVSANPWVGPLNGFSTGFDEFVLVRGRTAVSWDGSLRTRAKAVADAWQARVDDGAAEARDVVERWARSTGERPFFWFVNLMECHSPYLPPRRWSDLSGVDRVRSARDAARWQTMRGFYRVSLGEEQLPEEVIERSRRQYAASVRSLDAWLGWLLTRLDTTGRLDETVVVVTSDHGENLGDNGLAGHLLSMDDRLVRVPLVMAGPGVQAPPSGAFSLAGLPALLAGALDLPDPPWTGEVQPDPGVAVSQAATQVFTANIARHTKAWQIGADALARVAAPMACATDGRRKLVRTSGAEVLYDLTADPLEQRPVAAPAAVEDDVRRLRAALDAAERDEAAAAAHPVAGEAAGGGAPGGGAATGDNAELEERLKLLGYM